MLIIAPCLSTAAKFPVIVSFSRPKAVNSLTNISVSTKKQADFWSIKSSSSNSDLTYSERGFKSMPTAREYVRTGCDPKNHTVLDGVRLLVLRIDDLDRRLVELIKLDTLRGANRILPIAKDIGENSFYETCDSDYEGDRGLLISDLPGSVTQELDGISNENYLTVSPHPDSTSQEILGKKQTKSIKRKPDPEVVNIYVDGAKSECTIRGSLQSFAGFGIIRRENCQVRLRWYVYKGFYPCTDTNLVEILSNVYGFFYGLKEKYSNVIIHTNSRLAIDAFEGKVKLYPNVINYGKELKSMFNSCQQVWVPSHYNRFADFFAKYGCDYMKAQLTSRPDLPVQLFEGDHPLVKNEWYKVKKLVDDDLSGVNFDLDYDVGYLA